MPWQLGRRVRTTQPKGPVGINWANPVTRGLLLADNAAVGFDEVAGRRPSVSATPRVIVKGNISYTNNNDMAFAHAYYGNTPSADDTTIFYFMHPTANIESQVCFDSSDGAVGLEYSVYYDRPALFASDGSWSQHYFGSTTVSREYPTPTVASHNNTTGEVVCYLPWGIYSDTTKTGITGRDTLAHAVAPSGGGGYSAYNASKTALILFWGRVLTQAEALSILRNPWQVFEPDPLPWFIPSSIEIPQYLYPMSDISVGQWIPSTGGSISPLLADSDSGTYAYVGSASTFITRLTAGSDPNVDTGHIIDYEIPPGNGNVSVQIRQGTSTVIATAGPHALTGAQQSFSYTLTQAEAAQITDYTNLHAALVSS